MTLPPDVQAFVAKLAMIQPNVMYAFVPFTDTDTARACIDRCDWRGVSVLLLDRNADPGAIETFYDVVVFAKPPTDSTAPPGQAHVGRTSSLSGAMGMSLGLGRQVMLVNQPDRDAYEALGVFALGLNSPGLADMLLRGKYLGGTWFPEWVREKEEG